jgi:murein endopeptidase
MPLQAKAEETQGDLLRFLSQQDVPFRSYYIVNGIWVKTDIALLESLAKRGDVARIAPNPRIKNQLPGMEKATAH